MGTIGEWSRGANGALKFLLEPGWKSTLTKQGIASVIAVGFVMGGMWFVKEDSAVRDGITLAWKR